MKEIMIVDDHKGLNKAAKEMLEQESDLHIMAQVYRGPDILPHLTKLGNKVDLIVMDINLGKGTPDGLAYAKHIRKRFPHIKILMYSFYHVGAYIHQMHEAGIDGYLFKDAEPKEIIKAIRTICSGGSYYKGTVKKMLLEYQAHTKPQKDIQLYITDSESKILKCLAQNIDLQDIPDYINMRMTRFRANWRNLVRKFGTEDVSSLLRIAQKEGLI